VRWGVMGVGIEKLQTHPYPILNIFKTNKIKATTIFLTNLK
jgi:hypothetical protein